ncbi:lipopolysaccharide biosynthesis protein [Photobacterium lipolyticum]|uniref:Oligosaccharide translocase n=1 Tax=Photobacterium lipolyticum TaxID=266810 RepID=A0A2T3N0J9_9GAMM|nr:oligosaccharide flippase family protein [Photobacterium lipolyticum]PSW05758.1 oligosaccharide translocase [Photobacterium lipolyticum]
MKTLKLTAFHQTLLYGIGIVIMKGLSMVMLPWLAYQLTPAEMGRLEVLTSVAVLGSIVLAMGLEDALYRFVGLEKSNSQKKEIAAQIFGISLILSVMAIFIAPFLAQIISQLFLQLWSIQLNRLDLIFIFSFLALEALVAVCLGWLRIQDKAVVFFLVTVGRALLQAILVFTCVDMGFGVTGILAAGLVATLIQAVCLIWLQIRDTGMQLCFRKIKPVLIYSLPIVGSGLVSFPLAGLDRWLLLSVVDLETIAQYGVASKFALATVLLLQPFGMWWSPKRFEYLNRKNGHQQVVKYICVGLCLTFVIALVVSLASPWLIHQLFPAHYQLAAQYTLGLVMVMAVKEVAELVNIGCFIGRTTKTQFVVNLTGTLVGLSTMVALLFWGNYGVWGIIGGLLLAQLCRLGLFVVLSQVYLPLSYPVKKLACIACVSFSILAFAQLTHNHEIRLFFAFSGGLALLVLAVILQLFPIAVFRRSVRGNG